jgi:hypothetical protein
LLICGCALTAFARDDFRREFSKTVALPAGRMLRIEHQQGRINLRTQARNEVVIQAAIRCSAPSADEARNGAGQVQITVLETAAGVTVRTDYPHNWPRNISYAVDYDITMPETAPLDLRNRFGSTEVVNLHAPALINSGNGNVTFIGGRGRQRIENSFGSVEVRKNEGDVTINNGNGPVIASDVTGALEITNRFGQIRATNTERDLIIHSNNGNIEADHVGGAATISNSFGRVVVTEAKADVTVQNQNGEVVANGIGGTATLNTTFNSINFSRVGRALIVRAQNAPVRGDTVNGSATVETTFGTVDLRGVKGGARITTSNTGIRLDGIGGEVYAKATFQSVSITNAAGPITVEGQNASVTVESTASGRCQPIQLRTTFGPIRVTVPHGVGYNLTAHTTFGRIHTDATSQITISGDVSPDVLSGRIGAGGCDLRLNGQNSNIDIASR